MSVGTVRRAAALMRARAEAATPGGPRWETAPDDLHPSRRLIFSADSDSAITAAPADDAEHIASWHPEVARAVADWLDGEADNWGDVPHMISPAALAVARAYLGESA